MIKTVKDFLNTNLHFVLRDMQPAGYVEQFAPTEWKSHNAAGDFIGWFTTKRAAVAAL